MSLPAQLFYSTKIRVSIWFINKQKHNTDILFIDTRKLGHMISRTMKEFSDADIMKIADYIHRFQNGEENIDTVGFCKKATIDEVRNKKYNISPSKYITGSIEAEDIGEYLNEIDEDLRELSSIKKNIDGAKSFAQYQDKLRGNTFDSALEQIIKMTPDEASLTLREADLALDSRQKASKKINEITDKLFKYWFIDYNFPDENNEPYQLNFGDMKETEYGFIPCNWTIVKMGDILAASTEKVGDREGVPEYSTTNQGVFP